MKSPQIPFFGGATAASEGAGEGVKNVRGGKGKGSEFASFLAQTPADKAAAAGRDARGKVAVQGGGRPAPSADSDALSALLSKGQGKDVEGASEGIDSQQHQARKLKNARSAGKAVGGQEPESDSAGGQQARSQVTKAGTPEGEAAGVGEGAAIAQATARGDAGGQARAAGQGRIGQRPDDTSTDGGKAEPQRGVETGSLSDLKPAVEGKAAPTSDVAADGGQQAVEGTTRRGQLTAQRGPRQGRAEELALHQDEKPAVEASVKGEAQPKSASAPVGASDKVPAEDPLAGARMMRARQPGDQPSGQQPQKHQSSAEGEAAVRESGAEEAPRSRKSARQEGVVAVAAVTEVAVLQQANAPAATSPGTVSPAGDVQGRVGRLAARNLPGAGTTEPGDERLPTLTSKGDGKNVAGPAAVGFVAQPEQAAILSKLDPHGLANHKAARLVEAAFAAGMNANSENNGNGAEAKRLSQRELELGAMAPTPALPMDLLLNAPLNGGAPEVAAPPMLPPAAAPIIEHAAQDPNLSVSVLPQTAHMTIAGDDGRSLELHLRMLPEGALTFAPPARWHRWCKRECKSSARRWPHRASPWGTSR